MVPLEHDPKPVEGEPRLIVLDRARERQDEVGEASGGDDGAVTELGSEPIDERVDLAREAVDGTRLHRLHRRLADHVLRRDELDPTQGGGALEQRVPPDLDAGEDRAAEVLAFLADRLDRVRGTEVDHDRRAAVQVVGGHRVGDAVGPDLLRVVVEDRHPAADAGLHHERLEPEVATRHESQRGCHPGHPDGIATPVTWASNEKPWNPRNCWIISANSSSVRSATVAMRQWSASSCPLNKPITVCVLPASIASSTGQASPSMSRPRSSAGADCVIALVEIRSGPAAAYSATFSSVTRPETSTRTPGRLLVRTRFPHFFTSVGVMLSSMTMPAPAAIASATCSGRSHSTSTVRPGQRSLAECTAFATPRPTRWLSLIRSASDNDARWLYPPPARTAAFSSARRLGSVLRVSRMRTAPPAASTKARVAVATPDR